MFGLGLLVAPVVWGLLALWLGYFFAKRLLRLKKGNTESLIGVLLPSLVFAGMIFILPIIDEIIAYPKYQELCDGAGEFHFAPGVNESNVRGQEVYMLRTEERIMLFPDMHTLTQAEIQKRADERTMTGIVVIKTVDASIDAKTGKVLLSIKTVKPISSLFSIPTASGDRLPWLLHECGFFGYTNGKNNPYFYKSLQLKHLESSINNYILKEE